MTELRHSGRHTATSAGAPPAPDGVAPDEVWVPPPNEPTRPGDFIEYASVSFEVKRTHRGAKLVLLFLLVVALAGGGWFAFLRDSGGGTALPSCQAVRHELSGLVGTGVSVTDGGRVPTGIPVPSPTPGRVCTVAGAHSSTVLAMWPGAAEADYTALLAAGGWTATTVRSEVTVHANGADPHRVATGSVDGVLVAAFER